MSSSDILFPHIGISIDSLPKNFSIGNFTVAFYGVIIAFGMVMGILMARYLAKKTDQSPDLYSDFAIWGIVFALVGARLYFVIFKFEDYKDNLLQIFNIRGGGLAIYGGVIGALITAIVYCRIKKYSFFKFTDTAMPALVLGQVIGRYGNFMNREAFGEYTDSLFAMRLKLSQVNPSNVTATMKEHMVKSGTESYIQVHPTFLYESLWNVLVLVIMLLRIKKKKFDGEIFLIYFIGYGIGRAWIEGLRTDQLQIGNTGIAVSQILSAVLAVGGIVAWIVMNRKQKKKAE